MNFLLYCASLTVLLYVAWAWYAARVSKLPRAARAELLFMAKSNIWHPSYAPTGLGLANCCRCALDGEHEAGPCSPGIQEKSLWPWSPPNEDVAPEVYTEVSFSSTPLKWRSCLSFHFRGAYLLITQVGEAELQVDLQLCICFTCAPPPPPRGLGL